MGQTGQSLIEVLVAVGIVLFALVGAVAATTYSIRTSRVTTNQVEAGRYASQVIEQIQRSKSIDSEGFFTDRDCGNFGPFGDSDEYEVTVSCIFDSLAVDEAEVGVTVTWQEGNSSLSVTLDTVVSKDSGY